VTTSGLSTEVLLLLAVMSISGVSAWWSKNILRDIPKVKFFAIIGTISALFMVLSMW